MRRVALVGVLAGVVVSVPAPAGAGSGFWRSAGLGGVDAYGVYRTRPGRATVAFFLKDTRKDRRSAAVRLRFTAPRRRAVVRLVALHRDGGRPRWLHAESANTGHLYAQECLGRWGRKAFRVDRCGAWRRRY